MKKKLLSQALALVMCLGLCVPAYAASVTIKAPSGDMTVMLSDVISEETGTVYGETCKIYTVPTGSTLSAVGDEENVTHWYFPAQQISENGYIYDGSVYQPVPHDGIKLEESFLKSKLVVNECSMLAVTIRADVEETFLIKFADNAAPAAPAGFTDVAAFSPYKDTISWAVKEDIAAGYSSGTFRPGSTCTISHILPFLWRANGRPGDRDDERAAVAAWAKSLGIDTGDVSVPCTRAMAVSYLWKAAGSPSPSASDSFADVASSADYAKAVSWAVEKGITNGTGSNAFSPDKTCTRGQIVTFLYRASK